MHMAVCPGHLGPVMLGPTVVFVFFPNGIVYSPGEHPGPHAHASALRFECMSSPRLGLLILQTSPKPTVGPHIWEHFVPHMRIAVCTTPCPEVKHTLVST